MKKDIFKKKLLYSFLSVLGVVGMATPLLVKNKSETISVNTNAMNIAARHLTIEGVNNTLTISETINSIITNIINLPKGEFLVVFGIDNSKFDETRNRIIANKEEIVGKAIQFYNQKMQELDLKLSAEYPNSYEPTLDYNRTFNFIPGIAIVPINSNTVTVVSNKPEWALKLKETGTILVSVGGALTAIGGVAVGVSAALDFSIFGIPAGIAIGVASGVVLAAGVSCVAAGQVLLNEADSAPTIFQITYNVTKPQNVINELLNSRAKLLEAKEKVDSSQWVSPFFPQIRDAQTEINRALESIDKELRN